MINSGVGTPTASWLRGDVSSNKPCSDRSATGAHSSAVVGHELPGFDLSIFSVFGMIALCSMVLILIPAIFTILKDLGMKGHAEAGS